MILTGGTEELWKDIRKFIFRNIIECSTLPRESASAFGLGFYEIMIRPIKKLIERNYQFTNNKEENKMLNDCLIQALKQWIKLEPKHTQKVKEVIVENIEKKKISSLLEMDELLKDEYCERIYRNHKIPHYYL